MNSMILELILPITMYLFTFISGLIISISLGITKGSFNGDCPLYMEYKSPSDVTPGSSITCDFTIYMPVVNSIIYPFAMLIMYSYVFYRNFTGDDTAWKYIQKIPVMGLNTIIFILIFVAACIVSAGRNSLCSSYTERNKGSCFGLDNVHWTKWQYNSYQAIPRIILAEATLWISLIWWMALIIPTALEVWRKWRTPDTA